MTRQARDQERAALADERDIRVGRELDVQLALRDEQAVEILNGFGDIIELPHFNLLLSIRDSVSFRCFSNERKVRHW